MRNIADLGTKGRSKASSPGWTRDGDTVLDENGEVVGFLDHEKKQLSGIMGLNRKSRRGMYTYLMKARRFDHNSCVFNCQLAYL